MICRNCKEEKNEECFEIRSDTGKRKTACRDCERIRKRISARKHKDKHKYSKLSREEKDEVNRKHREYYWKNRNRLLEKARKRPSYKKYYPEIQKRYAEKNKKKINAYAVVQRRLKCGKIKKPLACQLCGKIIDLEAHHYDYNKPDDVIWLCKFCHKSIHSKYFNHDLS